MKILLKNKFQNIQSIYEISNLKYLKIFLVKFQYQIFYIEFISEINKYYREYNLKVFSISKKNINKFSNYEYKIKQYFTLFSCEIFIFFTKSSYFLKFIIIFYLTE